MKSYSFIQEENIVRIIDTRIFHERPRGVYILMELGETDFDKYLQSPAPAPEGTTPHSQGQGFQHDGGNIKASSSTAG